MATVLGSGMAFLDGTAVNVALPSLQKSLGADLTLLQWTIDAYLLFLASLLLVGGALGDRFGRRRVFRLGVVGFALASVVCGCAPSALMLVLARAGQGVAAALLVPGSLALMRSSYREEDQGEAIGAWSGLAGVTSALGPIAGGYLLDVTSWRAIFFLNLPLAALCLWATARFVPESRGDVGEVHPDLAGAMLATLGLGGVVSALIEAPRAGASVGVVLLAVAGVAATAAFFVVERRRSHPMLPLHLFSSRQFSGANAATLVIYAALSGATFVLPLHLQTWLGYSPLQAGLTLTPITVLMLVLSPVAAKVAGRVGYRGPMALGAGVMGLGLWWLSVAGGASFWKGLFPGMILFGLGLSSLVAPLTMAVLRGVERRWSGVASGVNNAVSRVAGLLAVAVLPSAVGLGAAEATAAAQGYERAMQTCAVLCVAGAALSWLTVEGKSSPAQ
jgi:EmrB/QacA subfamily drug resistance transporter